MRYIRILSDLINQIKYAKSKRVLVEVALIKMTRPAMENDYDSIINRVSQLEKQLENGVIVAGNNAKQSRLKTKMRRWKR